MVDFARRLHPASWRGVPFGLDMGQATLGRRKIEHAYPYRDTVWLEDQGKLPRRFRIAGFIIGNSAVYGGGDVLGQLKRMEAAAEAAGSGTLVHPTRGRLTLELLDLVISERGDEGNYFELQFTFVQAGTQVYPTSKTAAGDLVAKATKLADAAGLAGFVAAVQGPLQQGLAAVNSIQATAAGFIGKVESLARDATSLYGTVSQLGGANYGRFFNGRNSGFLANLVSPYAGASSIGDLITAGASLRAKVGSAADLVNATLGGLGVKYQAGDVGASIQGLVGALKDSAADPSDGIRIMSALAKFGPSGPDARTPAGVATTNLFSQAAASALARVSATYAPSSADDAAATRSAVLGPLEAAIDLAGNSGQDDVFTALRGVRKAVVEDLGARGGSLARLTEIASPEALPAVVLAHMQYGDASRGGELVTQADPIHPWFMPTLIKALAN